jgi:hypothetical protein
MGFLLVSKFLSPFGSEEAGVILRGDWGVFEDANSVF